MRFSKWIEKRMTKLRWYDVAMVKWCAVAFGLLVAKLWPPILSLNWYWYLIIVIVLAINPTYKFFFKKR